MWFQSPDFLLLTRKYLLTERNVQIIVNTLNITKDTRILDVGCGSGELTLRLSKATGCHCVGADLDERLITHAKQFETDRLKFYQANALELPFEDSTFDIIVSHTFLTSIFDAESALLEMQRVCKPEGTICAINTDTVDYMPNFRDSLAHCDWFVDYWKYKLKAKSVYHDLAYDCVYGLRPELIPQFFIDNGMEDVRLYQLGKLFSINDTASTPQERAELIRLECQVDSEESELLLPDERETYLSLLRKKRDYLLEHSNNCDFMGGTSLMVVSKNKKNPEALAQKQEKYRIIAQIECELKKHSVKFDLTPCRADLGAIASVKITSKNICVHTAQFSPLDATLAAYREFFAKWLLLQSDEASAEVSMTEQILSHIVAEPALVASRLHGTQHTFTSLQEQTLALDSSCAKWCLPKQHIAATDNADTAFTEALYDALATFSFKQIAQSKTTPKLIDEQQVKEHAKVFNILKRYGCQIRILDLSCTAAIPAVAVHLFNESGSLIRCAADFNLNAAVKKCLAKLFIGKKVNAMLSGSIRVVAGAMSDADLFNLITTGKQVLPECLIKPSESSSLEAFRMPKNTLSALLGLCGTLGLQICYRQKALAGQTACEVVMPDARMLWPFAKKRLNELLYTDMLLPLLSDLENASAESLAALANYMEGKLRWENENTLPALTDIEMVVPLLGVAMDYRLLLASIHIANKNFNRAVQFLPTYSKQLKCLKYLLNHANMDMLRQLFDAKLIANAQTFMAQPLQHITFR